MGRRDNLIFNVGRGRESVYLGVLGKQIGKLRCVRYTRHKHGISICSIICGWDYYYRIFNLRQRWKRRKKNALYISMVSWEKLLFYLKLWGDRNNIHKSNSHLEILKFLLKIWILWKITKSDIKTEE